MQVRLDMLKSDIIHIAQIICKGHFGEILWLADDICDGEDILCQGRWQRFLVLQPVWREANETNMKGIEKVPTFTLQPSFIYVSVCDTEKG